MSTVSLVCVLKIHVHTFLCDLQELFHLGLQMHADSTANEITLSAITRHESYENTKITLTVCEKYLITRFCVFESYFIHSCNCMQTHTQMK